VFKPSEWIQFKRRRFPKGIRRKITNSRNRCFKRTSERDLIRLFQKLKIEDGAVICVHSMLSSFGYLTGGPDSIIRAIQKAISDCTIMMPTFPFDTTMIDYIRSEQAFDALHTSSASGLLTNTLWMQPGCLRSLHPTHPCAALGPRAAALIDGSELSATPFGDDSTYGRFSGLQNAYILLLNTNGTSIVHRFQEIVGMPNLFLPELYNATAYNSARKVIAYRVPVHTPKLPLYAVMTGSSDKEKDYIWLPDYSFLFPSPRKEAILQKIKYEPVREFLVQRQDEFLRSGIIRIANLRDAEVAAIHVDPWQQRICEDLSQNIQIHREDYSMEAMSMAMQKGYLY
jgi:aminoglycoside N3'-acetyltransferase